MAALRFDKQGRHIVWILTFRGVRFLNTWIATPFGQSTKEQAFPLQVMDRFPDTPAEALKLIDRLYDCENEPEVILKTVRKLTDIERMLK